MALLASEKAIVALEMGRELGMLWSLTIIGSWDKAVRHLSGGMWLSNEPVNPTAISWKLMESAWKTPIGRPPLKSQDAGSPKKTWETLLQKHKAALMAELWVETYLTQETEE